MAEQALTWSTARHSGRRGVWATSYGGCRAQFRTAVGFSAAAAACSPMFGSRAAGIAPDRPLPHGGRYHGIWSMVSRASSVAAPILAAFNLANGGRLVLAATTVSVGFGAAGLPLAVFWQLPVAVR